MPRGPQFGTIPIRRAISAALLDDEATLLALIADERISKCHLFIEFAMFRFDGQPCCLSPPGLVSRAPACHGRTAPKLENSRRWICHPLAGFGRRPQHGRPTAGCPGASTISESL